MKPLAPGWAWAPVVHLGPEAFKQGTANLPPQTHFPQDTRAGLLERLTPGLQPLLPTRHNPHQGFIAALTTITAPTLLALYKAGACGILMTDPTPPERHAIHLATALGMAMAHVSPETLPRSGHRFVLNTLSHQGPHLTRSPHNPWPQSAKRVLPAMALTSPLASPANPTPQTTALAQHHPPPQMWLELMHGQREEVHIAQRLLNANKACGVGLLRLEYVLYSDPGMDFEDLVWRLKAIMDALKPSPLAIRLADWSQAKPPTSDTELMGWNGRRGLSGLIAQRSLALQIDAIARAAMDTRHQEVWCVAPFAQQGAELRQVTQLARGRVRVGAMIESELGLERWPRWMGQEKAGVEGLWLGTGDLFASLDTHTREGLMAQVKEMSTRWPTWVCGQPR